FGMTTVAGVFACPSCGAKVDEHKRRCPYCAAPIATVRCAACYHMNTVEAAHCSACGQDLGLEPVGKLGDLKCPRCKDPLTKFDDGELPRVLAFVEEGGLARTHERELAEHAAKLRAERVHDAAAKAAASMDAHEVDRDANTLGTIASLIFDILFRI